MLDVFGLQIAQVKPGTYIYSSREYTRSDSAGFNWLIGGTKPLNLCILQFSGWYRATIAPSLVRIFGGKPNRPTAQQLATDEPFNKMCESCSKDSQNIQNIIVPEHHINVKSIPRISVV